MAAPATSLPPVYAAAADAYTQRGWRGVLPLPAGRKANPPDGFTGYHGADPTDAQIAAWKAERPESNLGLRMPINIIGIDVDAYDGRHGGATLAELQARLGALPATPYSSSRDEDSVSGIRFFQVPPGLHFKNEPGRDIQIVQHSHRYAVVWPSIHPKGGVYRWRTGQGVVALVPPAPQDCAWLTQAWLDFLTEPATPRPYTTDLPTNQDDFCPERRFTQRQAWDFCRPYLDKLAAAPDGQINTRLNDAAKVLSHFGEEFWPIDWADEQLHAALSATVYDGATWKAETTIASARCSAGGDWKAVLAPDLPATQAGSGTNLPASFWDTPQLARIRQAALASLVSPDSVLHCVLARMAAYLDHRIRVDSGIGSPASLNYYSVLYGPPSSGKTQAHGVAEDLLSMPEGLDIAASYPLGTGEGIIECYMGWTEAADKDGKAVKVKKQVKNNALFYVDEGAQLNALMRRYDGTVSAVLRSMWNAEVVGMTNASAETTRRLRKGTYSLGLVVGYQPPTAADLIAMGGTGMAQRFVWASAVDPALTDAAIDTPGPLQIEWPGVLQIGNPYAAPGAVSAIPKLRLPDAARTELRAERLAINAGTLVLDELDGHRSLTLVKLAGLLALLHSRNEIEMADWGRAKSIWQTSCAVRAAVTAHVHREAQEAEDARTDRYAAREVAKAVAVAQVPQDVERVARLITKYVYAAAPDGLTNRQIRDKVAGQDKKFLTAAKQACVTWGWLTHIDGGLAPPRGR